LGDLKALVVGSGGMGWAHADCISRIPGVKLAAVASKDRQTAARMARHFGIESFGGAGIALRAIHPDIVYVCTPTPTHRTIALEAINAGCHVFCEKPLALTEKDGAIMVRAAKKSGVILLVGHVLRFFPEFRAMRHCVSGGELGFPAVVRTSRGGGTPRGYRGWYTDVAKSGGPLLDLVIHDFDWLRWTFGPVIRVHARAFHSLTHCYTLSVLRHAKGTVSHVEGFWGHDLPFRVRVEIAGSRGLIDFDSAHPEVFTLNKPASAGRPAVAIPDSPLAKSPYRAEDEHFIDVVRNGAKPVITPGDALEALKISLAALKSVRTGREVRL
jgi:predicted dehydrogenase